MHIHCVALSVFNKYYSHDGDLFYYCICSPASRASLYVPNDLTRLQCKLPVIMVRSEGALYNAGAPVGNVQLELDACVASIIGMHYR